MFSCICHVYPLIMIVACAVRYCWVVFWTGLVSWFLFEMRAVSVCFRITGQQLGLQRLCLFLFSLWYGVSSVQGRTTPPPSITSPLYFLFNAQYPWPLITFQCCLQNITCFSPLLASNNQDIKSQELEDHGTCTIVAMIYCIP